MKKYKNREEVPEKYKWDLTPFFKDEKAFNKTYEEVIPLIEDLKKYKGKLKDANKLYELIEKDINVSAILMDLQGYAYLKDDEFLGIAENVERKNKVLNLFTKYSFNISFFEPELLTFKKEEFENLFKNDKLVVYKQYLNRIYRQKEHILNENEEIIASNLINAADSYSDIASNLINNENDYGTITLKSGEKVDIATNNLRSLMRSSDKKIRKIVYNKYYKKIDNYASTLASLLNSYCRLNNEEAKIHHFKNAWERKLFNLNISNKVFETLIEETENNLDVLKKYYRLKKDILKLDELNVYDLSLPLSISDEDYSIEDAMKITLEAIKPLGEDYYNHFKKIYDRRYIDFCQYKGKCSGGYSLMTYKQDSRILMSYNGDFDSISTIIHEGGHNVNHQYISENKPVIYRMTPTIESEVMSLTNECLLSNYMVKHGKSKEEKLLGLENIMRVITSNLFGTVREGKIEQDMYKIIEEGSALTKDNMNKLVSDSLDKYYGDMVKKDYLSNLSWATRSHYYMDYYMYDYAICISVACNVAKEIIDGNKDMLDKYMKFLKAGSDKWPQDNFKILDIDLEDENVYKKAISYLDSLIDKYYEIHNS